MGEQHDRSAGLAQELDAKVERVKVLEEQVREAQVRGLRSPGQPWPRGSPNGSNAGDHLSPGFGAHAAEGSVAGSYVVDGFGSFEEMERNRGIAPYTQMHSGSNRSSTSQRNVENAHVHHSGLNQAGFSHNSLSFGASPSLALPPLQMSQGVVIHLPGEEASAARPSSPQPVSGSGGAADEDAEAAAAAYLLARSTERRVLAEAEANAGAPSSISHSPRLGSPRQLSSPLGGRHASHSQVQSPPLPFGAAASAPAQQLSTLDAMALRRLGEESHRPPASSAAAGTGGAHVMMSETMDLTQSHLSFSGASQGHVSYHSAVRAEQLGADAEAQVARSPNSSWNAAPSEVGETSRQSQELLNEMRRLRLQMSELERVAGGRHTADTGAAGQAPARSTSSPQQRSADRWGASLGGNDGKPGKPNGASAEPSSAVRSAASDQQHGAEPAGWEYRPHASGDPTDAAVAMLVNRPGRYRSWRALLCRLEQGVYLCGTRRVHLRADVAQEQIEASDDAGASWSDLEVLMKGAEASQRALLERARDSAGLSG